MAKTTIKQSDVRGLITALDGKQGTLTAGSGISIVGNTISAIPAATAPMTEWSSFNNENINPIPAEAEIAETATIEVYKNGLMMRPALGTPGTLTFTSPSTTISEWTSYSGTVDFKVNGTNVSLEVDFSTLGENDDLEDIAALIDQSSSSATVPFACMALGTDGSFTGLMFISASTGTSSTITLQDDPASAWTTLLGGNGTAVTGTNDEDKPSKTNINDVYIQVTNPQYIMFAESVVAEDNVCFKIFS